MSAETWGDIKEGDALTSVLGVYFVLGRHEVLEGSVIRFKLLNLEDGTVSSRLFAARWGFDPWSVLDPA